MTDTPPPKPDKATVDLAFEREKWEAERVDRDREFRIKEKELEIKEQERQNHKREVDAKIADVNRSRWANPLVIAILAGAFAVGGNIYVAYTNGVQQRDLEETRSKAQLALEKTKADQQLALEKSKADQEQNLESFKSESGLILEAIKTGDPDKASKNLRFLLGSNLVTRTSLVNSLDKYIAERRGGDGAATEPSQTVPASRDVTPEASQSNTITSKPTQPAGDLNSILRNPSQIFGGPNSTFNNPSEIFSKNPNGAAKGGSSFFAGPDDTVIFFTGWTAEGHNQNEACSEGLKSLQSRFSGKTLRRVSSDEYSRRVPAFTTSNNSGALGLQRSYKTVYRNEYNYSCTFALEETK